MGTRLTKLEEPIVKSKTISQFTPLIQQRENSKLTSFIAVIYYLLDERIETKIINEIIKNSNLKIKSINKIIRYFKLRFKFKTAFFKNIGKFNFDFIVKQTNAGYPIILNITKDGRDCYAHHSVIIVGYAITYSNKKYLVAYDNLYKTKTYIDYSKLHHISSINYLN